MRCIRIFLNRGQPIKRAQPEPRYCSEDTLNTRIFGLRRWADSIDKGLPLEVGAELLLSLGPKLGPYHFKRYEAALLAGLDGERVQKAKKTVHPPFGRFLTACCRHEKLSAGVPGGPD